ncbi:hypothetical protein BV22DRAFT_1085889 [Leucogyrophana mollusca]|uniref:Uncharacterized protein n=1 Tax=Leucogyrophana mollusca TaxID=85980 RepID=A0ACB8BMY8_9AGAM|nr:hypothetical protein BV22DRAFT_1085889 [Leucogyrophana mollusca]
MSSQRSSAISPLKERNSPDPNQSSILRDSALGWGKSPSTTPLRIAKRDSQQQKPPFPLVARRSSSSYKHLRNNNLVSKSPFRSQIPTPSRPSSSVDTPPVFPTRRVSGEKRPRPDSMHEQAENERPFAFKRERRQSKVYQGLIEKEPVTKSPFKRVTSLEEDLPPPVPPKPSPTRPGTPSRPSLVSKRLHGPRTGVEGKRQRRKTVTFDERCDVLEFECEEGEDDPFFSDDDYGTPEEPSPPQDDSFESIQLGDPDESITGIVDAMIQSASTNELNNRPSTPPRNPSLPSDLETEDGVPYGRTHHADRARRRASMSSPAPVFPIFSPEQPQNDEAPSTPPRATTPTSAPSSAVPLGRSTHLERVREEHRPDELDEDVRMMPPSPSPAKQTSRGENANRDSLIPKFNIEIQQQRSHSDAPDPFDLPRLKDEPQLAELSFTSFEDPMDPANLSIGHSEVSLSGLDLEAELEQALEGEVLHDADGDSVPRLTSTPPPPTPDLSFANISSSASSFIDKGSEKEASPSPRIPMLNRPLAAPLPVRTSGIPTRTSSPSGIPTRSTDAIPNLPSGVTLRRNSGSPIGMNLRRRSASPLMRFAGRAGSPALRTASPLCDSPARAGSPAVRSGSPIVGSGSPAQAGSPAALRESASSQSLQSGGSGGRVRITREEVQRRLMRKRSEDSPLRDAPPPTSLGTERAEQIHESAPTDNSLIDNNHPTCPENDVKDDRSMEGDAEEEWEKERERRVESMSVMTDISVELATIQTAEKRTLNVIDATGTQPVNLTPHPVNLLPTPVDSSPQPRMSPTRPHSALDTNFDFGNGLGIGVRDSVGSVQLGEMRSALDRLMDDVGGSAGSSTKKHKGHVRVESVTQGTKAGRFGVHPNDNRQAFDDADKEADESMRTETDMDFSLDDHRAALSPPHAVPMQRAATDSAVYTGPSFASPVHSDVNGPPPISPTKEKDAIRSREELILEKRRQARKREEDESLGYYTPPRASASRPSASGSGRPSRRRSRSTGDVRALAKSDMLLDVGLSETEDLLAESISKELKRLDPERKPGNYRVREHEAIYASADADRVSHMNTAGDVNGGKAWKTVRRPSDMNEYSKQIKEYRSQEKPGKAHSKVFVRVLGVRGLNVPLPQQPTALTCTLNNGIHFVTTPECRLSRDSRIDQEFELIEHSKLEFTLTLKIRRDPHIAAQFKAIAPPPAPPLQPTAPPPKSKGGMLSFFSSSPKKSSSAPSRATPPPPMVPPKLPDNLARYLKQDGTLARAFISFKDVASRCDTRVFETSYPLIGQRVEAGGKTTTMEIGEIVLQMFRLPPLPGMSSDQLPQSLEECHRGLRHVAWHKVTYFEGTLTQNGGDCRTWRRRQLRVIGANLVAFNDITKKATATINLKKALAVEDTEDTKSGALSPGRQFGDDYDSLYGVERSFRLIFPGKQEILFFADTNDEKAKWLEVLRALVGHIPPNPLWAELVWERQQEIAKQPRQEAGPVASTSQNIPNHR